MKPFSIPVNNHNIPVISNFEIDDYAQALVEEFAPECIKAPLSFDIQHFVRQQLGCRIASMYLSPDGNLLGETFFRPAVITVYRQDGTADRQVSVPERTILLDSRLLPRPGAARFTLAHEAGHLLMHEKYYASRAARMEAAQQPAKDRSGMTDRDWLEHQADRFAAAILMNRTASLLCWDQLQDYLDSMYPRDPATANLYAEESFARHFAVSREAARLRLLQLNLRRIPGQNVSPRLRVNCARD